ncbi:MAG: shikimate dehydrogenase family protein, partial [Flavobacterium sp.]
MKDKIFGLVGRNISYSFSAGYFKKKFEKLKLDGVSYRNFDIDEIEELPYIIKNTKGLKGLNVTIPYKEEILPLLDKLSKNAKIIGAVNTITISKKGKLKGYNTDYYGFKKSLQPLLEKHHKKALILGTGGAAKAVAFALRKLKIEYDFVSRSGNEE